MNPLNQITTIVTLTSRLPHARGLLLAVVLPLCLALSPATKAVDPPPVGGYPNQNTATGMDALFSLTEGWSNTGNGFDALFSVTTGVANTATGALALTSNITGNFNTATGTGALSDSTIGNENTADGWDALESNTFGSKNTATGCDALSSNTTGTANTADGYQALFNSTGSNNIALGGAAGRNLTTGSNNIDIGNRGLPGESNTIRIGANQTHRATFIAGISGATVPSGVGVVIDTNSHLGTIVSSERFKDKIEPMDKASEAILALQPKTFRYKQELDPKGIPQFGLVAEQVEKVNPDLVARDEQGKAYTVRYEAINAMLLNEFLKEHRKVGELDRKAQRDAATIAELKSAVAWQEKEITLLTASLKEQACQIREVSDQLSARKPAPVLVMTGP